MTIKVTDSREQRKKKKTYAEVLPSGYDKERTFAVKQDINAVMKSATKEIHTVGNVTPGLSEIYNDLLKSEQNSPSPMLNLPQPTCTDTSTSKSLLEVVVNLMFALMSMVRNF